MKDFKIWRSILKAHVIITTTRANGTSVDKNFVVYTYEEYDVAEQQEKALATLRRALSPEIAQGFREYTSFKALREALIESL